MVFDFISIFFKYVFLSSILFHWFSSDGATALILAAKNGHAGVVKLLIENGADPYGVYILMAENEYVKKRKKNMLEKEKEMHMLEKEKEYRSLSLSCDMREEWWLRVRFEYTSIDR